MYVNVSMCHRFGVCCLFILDGTGTTAINQNCTYIQNPGFPSEYADVNDLSFTINRCSNGGYSRRLQKGEFGISFNSAHPLSSPLLPPCSSSFSLLFSPSSSFTNFYSPFSSFCLPPPLFLLFFLLLLLLLTHSPSLQMSAS